jgi:hypothetical protein
MREGEMERGQLMGPEVQLCMRITSSVLIQ